ncbi:MAG: protein-methionine-sulfoxide reductase catalytic subunit MsrP [Bacteroidota bacterium]
MAHVHLRPDWHLPESAATDPSLYRSRREVVKTLGLGTIALATLGTGCSTGRTAAVGPEDADLPDALRLARERNRRPQTPLDMIPYNAPRTGYPAPRNTSVPGPGRRISERLLSSSYNNFYELRNTGNLKDCWRESTAYEPYPWIVEVTGEVERPMTLDLEAVLAEEALEERVYRHRCVEAWSITVPWVGFPLSRLIDRVRPLSTARYVRFVSVDRPDQLPGQRRATWYQWPYYEALRMDEARNDLAFVVTGMYGEPLPKQNGSPIRVIVPWKYGFKGPKAIARMEFTRERPPTFWNDLQPGEYSWLSNVNPNVPHPRWSQATERFLFDDPGAPEMVPTLLFNGYSEQVGAMYPEEPRG